MKEEGDRLNERARDGLNSPCAIILVFQIGAVSARSFLFFGTGEKGNRLEGSGNESTCEGSGRLSQGDKAGMEMAAGRHTETHDRRAHHHESIGHRLSLFSSRGSNMYLLFVSLTGVCSVGELYTLHGE